MIYSTFCNIFDDKKNAHFLRSVFRVFLFYFSIFSFISCHKGEEPGFDGIGKRPVYLPTSALNDIKSIDAQEIEQTGPIFLLDTLFFMTEIKKGIHVFNVRDSASIENLVFFNIPAVTDFTISNGFLYADSWTDLLTIDITNLQYIELISREEAVFEPLLFPPLYQGIFECVDLNMGAVIDWENDQLENAKCQTFF